MSEPTKLRLAATLREHGLNEMAACAADGYYDDFESPLALPILQLVQDLRARGRQFYDLAERAMGGEWDGTLEESSAWFEREGKDLIT